MAGMQRSAAGSSSFRDEDAEPPTRGGVLRRVTGLLRRRREQVLYLVVGGWNTVFGYGIWALLQFLLGEHLHYLVVVLIAWPIAVLNAYLGYRYVVFRSRGSILRELPRFSLVYLVTLVINLVLLPIALRILPFNIYLTQAVLTVVVVIGSYLGHRSFSFGGRSRPPTGWTPSSTLAPEG
jgi:putative flippase GtrA